MSFKDTLWVIKKFNVFDSVFTIIYKASKRKFLILNNKKYTTEDWGYIFGRQFLLNDWGCPKAIISDKDVKFISGFWKRF